MAQDFLTAFALLLIIEGLMPGVAPLMWQKYLRDVSNMNPRTIRIVGIISLLAGAVLLQINR